MRPRLPRPILIRLFAALAAVYCGVPTPGAWAQPIDSTPGLRVRPLPSVRDAPGAPPALGSVPASVARPTVDAPIEAVTDPVVGSVDGFPIHLSELGRASQALPEPLRGLPFETLYPVLLDRMIDHQALVMMARRNGIEDNPVVKRDIQAAVERILEGAWLAKETQPRLTEEAIQARYIRQFANRPATEEIRARHILVSSESEAKKVMEDLRNGADFATLARAVSKDPDGQRGGDLGFFRREQVWPGFADVAFTLQPGQIAPRAVRNEFGWHIIKVEERRLVAPPALSDIHDAIKQELAAEAVQQSVKTARSQMVIHRFNLDGSEMETGPRFGNPDAPRTSLDAPSNAR